jgi:hypothetical protein
MQPWGDLPSGQVLLRRFLHNQPGVLLRLGVHRQLLLQLGLPLRPVMLKPCMLWHILHLHLLGERGMRRLLPQPEAAGTHVHALRLRHHLKMHS